MFKSFHKIQDISMALYEVERINFDTLNKKLKVSNTASKQISFKLKYRWIQIKRSILAIS